MGIVVRSVRSRQLRGWLGFTKLDSSVTLHQKSLRLNSALFNDRLSTAAVTISKVVLRRGFDSLPRDQCLRKVTCAGWQHILIHSVVLLWLQLLLTAVLGCIVIELRVILVNFGKLWVQVLEAVASMLGLVAIVPFVS